MLSSWAKEKVENAAQILKDYFNNPSPGYFKGESSIEKLNSIERDYLLKILPLSKLTNKEGCELISFYELDRFDFARYLLRSDIYEINVNTVNNNKSCFHYVVEHSMLSDYNYVGHELLALYLKGYSSKEIDRLFIKELYSKIKSQHNLVTWCIARCILLLDEPKAISHLVQKEKVMLTIISFKMKKPVGINYPNLLGVANSAFLHYREQGVILLHAMKYYGVYEEVVKKDVKKTFSYRLNDFNDYKPLQDPEFTQIVFKIFPELKSDQTPLPQVGQNL